ncbi:MAG: CPBP family intramembrane metalloprotease [Candidatus Poribacteria bacterium]|nr:CPBP family intramembrane metalloprotease [Candidatus Poribacteria bacterium]
MLDWLQEQKRKYLHGWDRRPTIILLGSSVLLTVHRFGSRRKFFHTYLAKYFVNYPLRKIFPYYYWFWTSAITLILLPALVVKFGVRDQIRDYGFRLTHGKLGWGFVLGGWILMSPLMLLALQLFPAFQHKYPLSKVAATSWQVFILYQISYGIYMLSWEFFFRGFMLFGLEKPFGNYSILIQTIPFALMHYSKPFVEATGSIAGGILLGIVALETRSFIYGAVIHWLVALTMDVLAIMWRSG